jgi:arylformamidase
VKRHWIDASLLLQSGMLVWPGDPLVKITQFKAISRGDSSNVSLLSLGAHTGTHMDAPRHFFDGGPGVDQLPLQALIGPARVIAIRDRVSIQARELRAHRIRRGERIIFKTYGSAARWRKPGFDRDYVYVTGEAAHFLADRGVRLVGVDYLSVGGFKKDSHETHRTLLGAGVCIIEGLELSRVPPGRYDLIALPLRILDADGAPARVVLRARG